MVLRGNTMRFGVLKGCSGDRVKRYVDRSKSASGEVNSEARGGARQDGERDRIRDLAVRQTLLVEFKVWQRETQVLDRQVPGGAKVAGGREARG